MNTLLAQPLLSLLVVVSVASIVGSLIYLAFRFLESKSAFASQIISGFVLLASLAFIFLTGARRSDLASNLALFYCLMIFVGLIGSFFHKNSIDKSKSLFSCFILMSAVALLIIPVAMILASVNPQFHSIYETANINFGVLGLIPVAAQSATTPFLIWVWKSYRLRPGMDKHLES